MALIIAKWLSASKFKLVYVWIKVYKLKFELNSNLYIKFAKITQVLFIQKWVFKENFNVQTLTCHETLNEFF